MTIEKWPSVFLGVVAVLVLSAGEGHLARATHVCSIAEARRLPLDTRVTVDGIVSTPSGAFASSFFDVGFGCRLQRRPLRQPADRSAPRAWRSRARHGHPGRQLWAAGPGPRRPGRRRARRPRRPAGAPAREDGGVGESTEGLLVSVKAAIVEAPTSDLPYGYKLFVNDGSGELQISSTWRPASISPPWRPASGSR